MDLYKIAIYKSRNNLKYLVNKKYRIISFFFSGLTIKDVENNLKNVEFNAQTKTYTFERKIVTTDTVHDFNFNSENYFMFLHINNENVWHMAKRVVSMNTKSKN